MAVAEDTPVVVATAATLVPTNSPIEEPAKEETPPITALLRTSPTSPPLTAVIVPDTTPAPIAVTTAGASAAAAAEPIKTPAAAVPTYVTAAGTNTKKDIRIAPVTYLVFQENLSFLNLRKTLLCDLVL